MGIDNRDITQEVNGLSRIRLPDGSRLAFIREPAGEQRADETPFPDNLKRLPPGYLSNELTDEFDIDFGGAKGLSQDITLVYSINDVLNPATPAATFQRTSGDTVQEFSAVQLLVGEVLAKSMLVSVVNNPIRYAFISDPDQVNAGHPLAADEIIRIDGTELIRNFHFISETAASPGVLSVTMIA